MTGKAAADEEWIEPTAEERALASLDLAVASPEPPPGLWAKIERRLAAEAPDAVPAGLDLERFADGPWRRMAPGVRMKRLWGKHMFLLDCEPGAVVPPHKHTMFEHTLILSGDVVTEDGEHGAGDYFGMAAGTEHAAWSTRAGCRVLIQYDAAA
jgi:anti-sigma factor ChrR (cupin superfamily)